MKLMQQKKTKSQVRRTSVNSAGHCLAGINNASKLYVKQYSEGFTGLALNRTKFDNQWMKDSGRLLAVANPQAPFTAPEQFNDKASKERKRYKKKALKLWQNLIAFEDDLFTKSGSYSIHSSLSKDIPRICREQSRQEYYLPFAFNHNGQPIGGSYIHAWEAGTPKQIQSPRQPVRNKSFTEFFTGGCLFGVTLYGIDQFGQKHSLTNPGNEIPETSKIQSISSPYDIHPDEILTRESLINIIHMVKALGNENTRIKYHLPFANYIIYGLNWFLKGKMTLESLSKYIETVRERVNSQRSYLESISSNFAIYIDICSTLDVLGLDKLDSKYIFDELFKLLDIQEIITNETSLQKLAEIKQTLFDKIVHFMQSRESETGQVWQFISQKIANGDINTNESNLLSLNYLDYSASLAVSSLTNEERCAASILPSHESPINHFYKKVLSEEFGAVTCFQWLSPLQVHDSEIGPRAAHMSEHIEDMNELLKLGILRKNFLQTAAAALNSKEMGKQIASQINEILSLHQQSIELRAKKEKLIGKSSSMNLIYLNLSDFSLRKFT